jgi:hypothetical protein
MDAELTYYKRLAGSLSQTLREQEEGYYRIRQTQFNPRPDVC